MIRRGARGLVALAAGLLLALPARAAPVGAGRYLDPPQHGFGHEGLWVLEVAPLLLVLTHASFREDSTVVTTGGLDLRVARGLSHSGDEVGLRLRPFAFERGLSLSLSGGYRVHAGRERWKSYLELELFTAWLRGPEVGVRLGAGGLYEVSRRLALVLDLGAAAAVGAALVGVFDTRLAVQLRF